MTKKVKQYSATEKAKIVMGAIKAKVTVAQISSKCMLFIELNSCMEKAGYRKFNQWISN
jgi:hypothetical protein